VIAKSLNPTIFERMKAKSWWWAMVMAIVLMACEKEPERVVTEQWSETQPKLVSYYLEQDNQRMKVKEEKFYQDGTREYVGGFDEKGLRNGEWRYYYDSGQLWSLGGYDHGLKEGKKEVYWPDGTKRYEGQFKEDLKSGTWTFYNPDGTILQKMNFDAQQAD
jgi:antitoxin component YwqK of YwqJK toxin-antitoxin module